VRWSRPSLLVFCAALIASLSIHLPVYTVLGKLAKVFDSEKPAVPPAPSVVEFEVNPTPQEPLAREEPKPKPEPKQPQPHARAPKPPEPKPEPRISKAEKPEPPKPELKLLPKPTPTVPPPPDTTKPIQNKLAVTQKSDDPNVPPPDDARFIAEQNRRVAEESIASVRSLTENDEQPTPSPSTPAADSPGNAQEDEPAELQKVQGEDKRIPDKREAREKPLTPSQLGQGEERAEAVAHAPTQGGAPSKTEAQREVAAGSERVGGEEDMLVIQDGAGSIRIRRALPGQGAGDAGGEAQKGAHTPQSAREAGARAGNGTNLKLSWSQFESTFGAEQLREQRDAYLEQRRSKSRGGQREEDWRKFRAAVENFVDKVKPGNQTALNAAASPFAAYLAEVHRTIHREFAMRFLRSLPLVGGAFADSTLVTRLEIVINQDGSLHEVGVIRTSGFSPFDYGAWNAVMRGAPYPAPPKKILSGDGRVYVRWDFYNNERQCGTFNAEPFILPNPGGEPKPAPGPLHDRGDVPSDGKLGMRAPSHEWESAQRP
jgi:TonB family protein